MKQKYTFNLYTMRRAAMFLLSCLLIVGLLSGSVQNIFAETFRELQGESSKIQKKISRANRQATELEELAQTLEEAIEELDEEIAQSNREIKRTTKKVEGLQVLLDAAHEELDAKKALLRANMRELYKRADVSTFELLASSESFSEFIDEQEYLERLKLSIQDTTEAVLEISLDISGRQNEQKELLLMQETMKESLADAREERELLLDETTNEGLRLRKYSQNLTKRQQEINREFLRMSQMISTDGGGGYPWASALCVYTDEPDGACLHPDDSARHYEWYFGNNKKDRLDPWGYFLRNCTSYVAWRSAQEGFALDTAGPNRRSLGDGGSWGDKKNVAKYEELSVGREPKVGSFAVFKLSGFGHVAFVEEISGDRVRISEYNFAPFGSGGYSERWIPRYQPSSYVYTPYSK